MGVLHEDVTRHRARPDVASRRVSFQETRAGRCGRRVQSGSGRQAWCRRAMMWVSPRDDVTVSAMDERRRARRLTLIADPRLATVFVEPDGGQRRACRRCARTSAARSPTQQWVVEAYLLLLASLILVGGSLGDLYGRRRIFAIGWRASAARRWPARSRRRSRCSSGPRAAGRVRALPVPSSRAIITTVYPPASARPRSARGRRARARRSPSGRRSAALVDAISWRGIFAMHVRWCVCLWPDRARGAGVPGQTASTASTSRRDPVRARLAGPTYALIEQPLVGWSRSVGVGRAAGRGRRARRVRAYERRAPDPMLPPSIFRSRNFAVGNVVTLTAYGGLGAASSSSRFSCSRSPGTRLRGGHRPAAVTLLLIGLSRALGALAARVAAPAKTDRRGPTSAALGMLASRGRRAWRLRGRRTAGDAALRWARDDRGAARAAVLQAAERRHAGIASGVNNAIARVAGSAGDRRVGAVVSAQFGVAVAAAPGRSRPRRRRDVRHVEEARERPLAMPAGRVDPPCARPC